MPTIRLVQLEEKELVTGGASVTVAGEMAKAVLHRVPQGTFMEVQVEETNGWRTALRFEGQAPTASPRSENDLPEETVAKKPRKKRTPKAPMLAPPADEGTHD